jgi:hypothetical protein
MQYEEEFIVKGEDDALADAAEGADGLAFDGGDGWDGRAEEEGEAMRRCSRGWLRTRAVRAVR